MEAGACVFRFQACELPEFMVSQYEAQQQLQTHRHRNQALIDGISMHLEAMQLGPVHKNTVAPGSAVHIDILLPEVTCEGKQVAITILGVNDTAKNTGLPLGHWLLRCRLIESYGLHVLNVADEAWVSSTSPDVMLRRLLQDCTCSKALPA